MSSIESSLNGELIIGQQQAKGSSSAIYAVNPANNEKLEPAYLGGTKSDVNQAAELAWAAFDHFRETAPELRATFLETIADEILALGDELIQRGMAETGLPQARLEGERGRTMNQLKLFASVVRQGHWLDARLDKALPDRAPLPRPDLRLRNVAVGPVAVFGASNFPLAFSVAGGDTASALAAGCPVIVKAHSAHPGTAELIGRAVQTAVAKCELPEGVFSLLFGSGKEVGAELVKHPLIKAVGFTGSQAGGTALMALAAARPEPIPVYAEMSSINPVFLLPGALQERGDAIAKGFVGSLQMGAGQFCTNPGLVIAKQGLALDAFKETVQQALQAAPTQTMLTPGIHKAYEAGIGALTKNDSVSTLAQGSNSDAPNQCQAGVYTTSAEAFLAQPELREEVFGSASLIVECSDIADFLKVLEHLEGQLTATLQMNEEDTDLARSLLPALERKVGRILCNGFPTGVEVSHTMVHGGPFPATSDSRSTSVGSNAIYRFLRPVSYQDLPEALLPESLKNENILGIRRLVEGEDQR